MKKMTKRLLTFLSLSLLLSSCFDMPKEPTMPTWNVDVNVPIAGDSYTMADILDTASSEYLGILREEGINDSLYYLLVDDIENTSKVKESIKVNPLIDPVSTHLVAGGTGGVATIGYVVNPDEEYHLISATFTSGGFHFELQNNNANPVDFSIKIPGFKHKVFTDSTLTIGGTVGANQTISGDVPVADFIYHELPVHEGAPLIPPYNYQNSTGFLVVVEANATNDVDLNIYTSTTEMGIARLEGRIKRTDLGRVSQTIETGLKSDIENFTDAVHLGEAKLDLRVQTFGEMANLTLVFEDVRIVGYLTDENDNITDSVALVFNGTESFTDSVVVGQTNIIEFNQDNSNIIDFFTALPKSIKITNNVILAPYGEDNQIVSTSDSVRISAEIFAPVVVSVSAASYDGDEEINLTDEDKDKLKNVRAAYVKVFVENEIPAYVVAHAEIVDENDNVLFEVHDLDGNKVFTFLPADVDENGISLGPKESELSVAVNQDEINQIIDYGAKVRFSVLAYTTGSGEGSFGPYVRIKSNYRISYRLSAGGIYHVDFND